jgi:hypothetical protein
MPRPSPDRTAPTGVNRCSSCGTSVRTGRGLCGRCAVERRKPHRRRSTAAGRRRAYLQVMSARAWDPQR